MSDIKVGAIVQFIGLIFNLIGALVAARSIIFKHGEEKKGDRIEKFVEIGQKKGSLKAAIIFLAIGFLLQAIGVLLN